MDQSFQGKVCGLKTILNAVIFFNQKTQCFLPVQLMSVETCILNPSKEFKLSWLEKVIDIFQTAAKRFWKGIFYRLLKYKWANLK